MTTVLLAGCRQYSWHDDIAKMRAELSTVSIPADAPLYMPEFDEMIKDYSPIEPDIVYEHILRKMQTIKPEEVRERFKGEFDYARCLKSPGEFRGNFWRVRGTVYNIEAHRFPREIVSLGEIHQCVIYTGNSRPLLVHLAHKPDPLYIDEDTVQFDGIFIKLLVETTETGDVIVPFFLSNNLRRYF